MMLPRDSTGTMVVVIFDSKCRGSPRSPIPVPETGRPRTRDGLRARSSGCGWRGSGQSAPLFVVVVVLVASVKVMKPP